MNQSVALRERGRLSVLLSSILQHARKHPSWHEPDQRNLRTWRQLLLAILLRRSTRLLSLAQALLPERHAQTVKALAQSLSYFLTKSHTHVSDLSPVLLEASLRHVDGADLTRYKGHPLLVLDPTEYPKRSRKRGKRNRQMQHVGTVRNAKGKVSGTSAGYVDVWAGLALKGKHFLPLARRLFSSEHPSALSQNQVEEAVLQAALTTAHRLGLDPIMVADRGLGRKALLIRLEKQQQLMVIRIDADITVYHPSAPEGSELAALFARQPWLGEVVWDRGSYGKLRCQARVVRGEIRFSRSGRKDDVEKAVLTFLQLVPQDGTTDPLVLATNLPIRGRLDAQGVTHVYAQRWCIESGFETMKSWGLEKFMVRKWEAIERLLWCVAVAYALATLLLVDEQSARLRLQAMRVLRVWGAVGRQLTVGKVAEALGLDWVHHRRAWHQVWQI
jgi:hypothetical protein